MFGRLLKHQLKSTWKEFNILFGAIVALGIILGISLRTGNLYIISCVALLFVGVIATVSILYVYNTYKIIFQQTYGKQGYLMFSIPISPHALIISKICTLLIYSIGFTISFIISISGILLIASPDVFLEFFSEISNLFASIYSNPSILIIELIVLLISTIFSLISLQFAAAVSNTGLSRKHRFFVAIAIYMGVSVVYNILTTNLDPIKLYLVCDEEYRLGFNSAYSIFTGSIDVDFAYETMLKESALLSVWDILVQIFATIGMYFASIKLLKSKIEIE